MRRLAALAVFAFAVRANAQDAPPIARYVPPAPDPAHVFVLDSAHILSPQAIAALQDSARALQGETGADVAWVTLPTLGGRPIEEAALYIGRTWRIGSPGKPGDPLRNRGLVVLYIPDKTKTAGSNFRIEVGNGLEGTITDARSRGITSAMREDLRAKRYDQAYLAGWAVAAQLVRADFAAARASATKPIRPTSAVTRTTRAIGLIIVAVVLALGLAIVALIVLIARHASGRKKSKVGRAASHHHRRRPHRDTPSVWVTSSSSDSSDSSSGGSDSGGGGGGDFGGGDGFSGGGSSDTI